MISKREARAIAENLLRQEDSSVAVAIIDEETRESERRWAFFYQSVDYLKTRDIRDALAGNGPILVEKADGTVRYGLARIPVEDQL